MDLKTLFIAEHERITAELEDAGMDSDTAYELASTTAYDAARDRFLDMADDYRQRAKDGDL